MDDLTGTRGAMDALNIEDYGVTLPHDKGGAIVFRKARPRPSDIRELDRKIAMLVKQPKVSNHQCPCHPRTLRRKEP